jgi:diguanylate cyclase (GGDEF)-like protein
MFAPRGDARSNDSSDAIFGAFPTWMIHALLIFGWLATLVWEVQFGRSGLSLPWELAFVLYCTWRGFAQWGLAAIAVAELVRFGWIPAPVFETANFVFLELLMVWWVHRLRTQFWDAHRHARRDSLTDLPNRLALEEFLEAEISRAARFTRPFSVGLLDCDGFKELNDRSGHLAGDAALQRIGQVLRRELRGYDGVFRLGGDEFVIVLPETGRHEAEHVCERLRTAFSHEIERTYAGLTACLGVVIFTAPPANGQECLQRADETMYRAKRRGPGETQIETVDVLPKSGLPRMIVAKERE